MMLVQASIGMGVHVHVLDPDPNCSCHALAASHTIGSFKDFGTVLEFGRRFKHITVEIEAVNTAALHQLVSEGVNVYPRPEHLELIQDKGKQKAWYSALGLPTSPYVITQTAAEVLSITEYLPAAHKLCREGYDGKGVVIIHDQTEVSLAFDGPAVLEKLVDIDREFSILIARNADGSVAMYPAVEQVFHPTRHVLEYLLAPAELPAAVVDQASDIAQKVVRELDYVGLLAIEFFLSKSGEVLINEMAPRPHNSGHHTIKACHTSQFEQHIRAVLNMPLGSTEQHSAAAILNVLGQDGSAGLAAYQGLEDALATEGVYPFLYGKQETRPFRKMGHVTVVASTRDALLAKLKGLEVSALASQ